MSTYYVPGSVWDQGQRTTCLRAKSGPQSVLVDKSLCNIATLIHLNVVYGCFLVELSSCDESQVTHKAKSIYSLAIDMKSLLILF